MSNSSNVVVKISLADLLRCNNLKHSVAGATGSVEGMSTFYPLDTVRTRLLGTSLLYLDNLVDYESGYYYFC